MKAVTVYSTDYCPYCTRAKKLLAERAIPFTEHDVTEDPERRRWLVDATGQRTVPQIFFGDEPIGGCSDLEALIKSGKLDARLNG